MMSVRRFIAFQEKPSFETLAGSQPLERRYPSTRGSCRSEFMKQSLYPARLCACGFSGSGGQNPGTDRCRRAAGPADAWYDSPVSRGYRQGGVEAADPLAGGTGAVRDELLWRFKALASAESSACVAGTVPSKFSERTAAGSCRDRHQRQHNPISAAVFSELNSLLNSFGDYELTVIQCDAEIQDVEKYDSYNQLRDPEFKTYGHGGTDFNPPFEYLEDHPEIEPSCLIYITDGFAPAPKRKPEYPVLWLLTADGSDPAPWGWKLRLG